MVQIYHYADFHEEIQRQSKSTEEPWQVLKMLKRTTFQKNGVKVYCTVVDLVLFSNQAVVTTYSTVYTIHTGVLPYFLPLEIQ